MNTLRAHPLHTPIGDMLAVFSPLGLCLLEFADRPCIQPELQQVRQRRGGAIEYGPTAQSDALQQQLDEYFSGQRQHFDLALDCIGTPFEQQVWQTLPRIPYGHTLSYLQQAAACGKARAVRAVAAANGRNKIPIVLACHRVIGSQGQLTGYSGGLERKRYLLALEARHAASGAARESVA